MSDLSPVKAISAYRILELPVTATDSDIAERGENLSGQNHARKDDYRRAQDELLVRRRDRLRHQLLEIPGAVYGPDAWEVFCKKFERNPVGLGPQAQNNDKPGMSDFDWKALLRLAIEERISASESDVTPAIRLSPFQPGFGRPPINVYDVIFG